MTEIQKLKAENNRLKRERKGLIEEVYRLEELVRCLRDFEHQAAQRKSFSWAN
jgi:cell division protein FtsB